MRQMIRNSLRRWRECTRSIYKTCQDGISLGSCLSTLSLPRTRTAVHSSPADPTAVSDGRPVAILVEHEQSLPYWVGLR